MVHSILNTLFILFWTRGYHVSCSYSHLVSTTARLMAAAEGLLTLGLFEDAGKVVEFVDWFWLLKKGKSWWNIFHTPQVWTVFRICVESGHSTMPTWCGMKTPDSVAVEAPDWRWNSATQRRSWIRWKQTKNVLFFCADMVQFLEKRFVLANRHGTVSRKTF